MPRRPSRQQERERDAEDKQRKRAPKLVAASDFINGLGHATSARHQLIKALDVFRKVDLSDGMRESALEDLHEVENVLGWLLSYVESGDRSFDAELDKLLGGDA